MAYRTFLVECANGHNGQVRILDTDAVPDSQPCVVVIDGVRCSEVPTWTEVTA